MEYVKLVEQLVRRGVLQTPSIIEAFREVRREHFLPADMVELAGQDRPLPIGHGQTNSQPYTVAFMLELLQPLSGQNLLDVGCGSGWTTALLAHIVGTGGRVTGTERIDDLADKARARIENLEVENAAVLCTPTEMGYRPAAPYDGILVSAAATELPQALLDQLADGGCMVIPVQHSIFRVVKTATGIDTREYPGFSFVPLIN